jgi:hypothetical protein
VYFAEVISQAAAVFAGPSVNSLRVVISLMESYLLLFIIGHALLDFIISQLQLVFNRFFSLYNVILFHERIKTRK